MTIALDERCRKRLKEIATAEDVGHYAKAYLEDVTALLAAREYASRHITDLQSMGTQLIDDQRDLKRLVKGALAMLSDDANGARVIGAWVLQAQAMLERMK